MWRQVLHISTMFLPYTPYVSTFSFLVFLALACFSLTGSLKVWRYWLHISFWHTAKYAISRLHAGDWLTWQVSSLCIKHIKIVLHAAVVFNRNSIQLTQVFSRRFFSFHLMLNLLGFWQVHKSSRRPLFLGSLCCLVLKLFYPEITGPGDESKRLSSAVYLASRDRSFIT